MLAISIERYTVMVLNYPQDGACLPSYVKIVAILILSILLHVPRILHVNIQSVSTKDNNISNDLLNKTTVNISNNILIQRGDNDSSNLLTESTSSSGCTFNNYLSNISDIPGNVIYCYEVSEWLPFQLIFDILVMYVIPSLTMVGLYVKIISMLISSITRFPEHRTSQIKLRAVKCLLLIVIMFIGCWAPIHVMKLIIILRAYLGYSYTDQITMHWLVFHDVSMLLVYIYYWGHMVIYVYYNFYLRTSVAKCTNLLSRMALPIPNITSLAIPSRQGVYTVSHSIELTQVNTQPDGRPVQDITPDG